MSEANEGPPEAALPGRLGSRPVHDGRIVHLSVDTVRFPDGSVGELEMVRHSGASAVLPVLGAGAERDPEILLLRQYRYATNGYIWEVPAGRRDFPGEDWEVCARRELEEETGLIAGSLRYLTAIYTTPGFTDEFIHLYLAGDLREGTTAREADEFIEVVELRLSAALRMVADGEISDAKTVCALLYAHAFVVGTTGEPRVPIPL